MKKKASVKTLAKNKPIILQPSLSLRNSTSMSQKLTNNSRLKPLISNTNVDNAKKDISFPYLPLLSESENDEIPNLLMQKLKLLHQIVDFSENNSSTNVVTKTELLNEVLIAFKDPEFKFPHNSDIYAEVFSMIAWHIYRTPEEIPKLWKTHTNYYFDLDEINEAQWLHKSLVYSIAIAFIGRSDFDIKLADMLSFDLFKLSIYLFRTYNPDEQDKLVNLFAVLYPKLNEYRSFAHEIICYEFIRIINDNEPFTVTRPLLRVYSLIINGFKVPLSQNKLETFKNIIMPLHKHLYLDYFGKELIIATTQFLEKESSLAIPILEYIRHHWPIMYPVKQLILIEEIGIIASFLESKDINRAVRLFYPIFNRTVMGVHLSLSLKVLSLFEINDFVWFLTEQPEVSYPLIIPALFKTAKAHWSLDIRDMAVAVLNVLRENNPHIFNALGEAIRVIESNELIRGIKRAQKWKYIVDNFESSKIKRDTKLNTLSSIFVGCESLALSINQ